MKKTLLVSLLILILLTACGAVSDREQKIISSGIDLSSTGDLFSNDHNNSEEVGSVDFIDLSCHYPVDWTDDSVNDGIPVVIAFHDIN